MDDFIVGMLIGVSLACFGIRIGFEVSDRDVAWGYHEAKKQCESELPRNKQCVMTFVEGE